MIAKQAGFTIWFVMLVSLGGHKMSVEVGDRRLIDVGVGLAVSLVITAILWPHGVADRVREVLDRSVRSTADYVTAAFTFVTSAMTHDDIAAVKRAAQTAVVARDRGSDAFDVALSEGGADGDDAAAWETVFNAVDHAFFAATMVRELQNYGLVPLPDATVGAGMRTAAAAVAGQLEAAVDTAHDRLLHTGGPVTTAAPIDAASAQTALVERTIKGTAAAAPSTTRSATRRSPSRTAGPPSRSSGPRTGSCTSSGWRCIRMPNRSERDAFLFADAEHAVDVHGRAVGVDRALVPAVRCVVLGQ